MRREADAQAQIDTSVVNLAARPIGEHFDAGVSALQWVIDTTTLAGAEARAALGAVFALRGGGADGPRLAMLVGGAVQVAASALEMCMYRCRADLQLLGKLANGEFFRTGR